VTKPKSRLFYPAGEAQSNEAVVSKKKKKTIKGEGEGERLNITRGREKKKEEMAIY